MTPERRAYMKAWAKAHPEVGRAKSKRYSQTHKAEIKARRLSNKQKERVRNRISYAARSEHFRDYRLKNRDSIAKSKTAWVAANADAANAISARWRAAKRAAMPIWADIHAIRAVYAEAVRLTKATGIKHEVDHIVPLNSPIVCGLHIAANLQVLSKTENRRKLNKLLHHSSGAA